MTSVKRKILIAGMGMSPGGLTNVVWALAHQDNPVVPDEVVVFITMDGKNLLRREKIDVDWLNKERLTGKCELLRLQSEG